MTLPRIEKTFTARVRVRYRPFRARVERDELIEVTKDCRMEAENEACQKAFDLSLKARSFEIPYAVSHTSERHIYDNGAVIIAVPCYVAPGDTRYECRWINRVKWPKEKVTV